MSLIIARQIGGDIYIIGDTKFSGNENNGWSRAREYFGGLKVVLLNPGLCIGFAGNIEFARDTIQRIYDKDVNLFDKNQAIDHFLKHHKASINHGHPTDFIVAAIIERHDQPGIFEKELFRIADSSVYWENVTTHIGDKDAFNNFQKVSHGANQVTPLPTFEISRLGSRERPSFDRSLATAMQAMQHVIDDISIPSVDGIRTAVISEVDQFRYVEYLQIRGNPIPVLSEPGSPLSFGGAAEGSDHKHVALLSSVGHGIFPVYSIAGQFGVIYQPEICFEPQIEPNCTFDEFRLKVEGRIKIAHQRALEYQSHL